MSQLMNDAKKLNLDNPYSALSVDSIDEISVAEGSSTERDDNNNISNVKENNDNYNSGLSSERESVSLSQQQEDNVSNLPDQDQGESILSENKTREEEGGINEDIKEESQDKIKTEHLEIEKGEENLEEPEESEESEEHEGSGEESENDENEESEEDIREQEEKPEGVQSSDTNINSKDYNLESNFNANSESESESAFEFESESESEPESDSDEEEEPHLKYSRITCLPPSLFNSELVSCCLSAENFIVFATHSGMLYICQPDLKVIRTIKVHRASVVSLSTDGNYIASASIDGTVVIGSFLDAQDITASDFKRPVNTVSLDPNHSKTFISGGMKGEILYSEKGWLGKRSDTILDASDDPIVSSFWLADTMIWINDNGVTFYNYFTKTKILQIPPPKEYARAALYSPKLCQLDTNRIVIAWGDTMWVIKITQGRASQSDTRKKSILSSGASIMTSSERLSSAKIESILRIDAVVAGIQSYGQDMLMTLCIPFRDSDGSQGPPNLKLVEIQTGEEVSSDELSVKNFERLGPNDYHLCVSHTGDTDRFLIVSPRDAITVTKRTINDRLDWLVEHNRFDAAWNLSAEIMSVIERKNLGIKWVESLVKMDEWSHAAEVLVLVLNQLISDKPDRPRNNSKGNITGDGDGENGEISDYDLDYSELLGIYRQDWNTWGFIFTEAREFNSISPHLPKDPSFNIDSSIYDSILIYFLEHDVDKFANYMKTWSTDLYNCDSIKQLLVYKIDEEKPRDPRLQRCLSDLYITTNQALNAVPVLLDLHDPSLLNLISQYHLLPFVAEYISGILEINMDPKDSARMSLSEIREHVLPAISLFVSGRHEILPATVMESIMKQDKQYLAFLYLEKLNEEDSFAARAFGDLQVKLYAEFDRAKLIAFLRRNNNYVLEQAISVCEERDYVPELVYLLGKVGQNKRALMLIIDRLQDPDQAIEFAKAQKDKDLWDSLIKYSLEKPLFVKALLKNAGDLTISINQLVERIPKQMDIPGLQQALVNIYSEREVHVSLSSDILAIIQHEACSQAEILRVMRSNGSLIDINNSDVKLSGYESIIKLPDGSLKSEKEILGNNHWRGSSTGSFLTRKLAHLSFLKSRIEKMRDIAKEKAI